MIRLPNLCSAIRATLGQRQFRQSPGLALNAHSGNEWGKIPVLTGSFQILCVFIVSNVIHVYYMTLSPQQKSLFQQKIPWRHLFFYSLQTFAPIPQHYFSKYWGDQCIGRPPPQILGGTSPI